MDEIKLALMSVLFAQQSCADSNMRKVVKDGKLCRTYSGYIPAIVQKAIDSLLAIDVFADPYSDWMFSAGVIEKQLLHLNHIRDPILLNLATVLYSKLLQLYPFWLDVQRIPKAGFSSLRPEEKKVQEDIPEEEKRRRELVTFARKTLKLDESTSDISAEELAQELLERERRLMRG